MEGADHVRDVMLGNRHTVPVTGVPAVDVMGDVLNDALDPFTQLPWDEDGSIDWLSYTLNMAQGVLGALGILENIVDHGIAVLLAPFAQMMEMPAAQLGALHVGMPHGHTHPPSLVPPNPVPVPLPSLGSVMLSGAVTVLIGGVPAARAGDIGLAPTCGSIAPAFLIVTGSSSVFIGGGRAARMGDLTIHCNPILAAILKFEQAAAVMGAIGGAIGVASQAASGNAMGAVAAAIQAAADVQKDVIASTVGMDPGVPPSVMGAITLGLPTVLIGGLPVPPADIVLGWLSGELEVEEAEGPTRRRHATEEDPEDQRASRAGRCLC
ncbi:MAG: PAAR domain-containing protein [Myxococcales bacterium]|nr:PAAR domain-containing protein [Myxococcales bacterium]